MLFKNEKIDFEVQATPELDYTEEDINKKYNDGEIRIVTEQARYPLDTISEKIVHNPKYQLNPEFQRRHRWDVVKQSLLIESLIINVPIPPIFLYEYEFSQYEVMDGLQRLTAISSFYDNKFQLQGLTHWKELNGMTYSQLPERLQAGIDRRYISSIILLKETAKTKEQSEFMKQMVFDRLNSGGVKLEPQEKRNSNFNGNLNKLCIELSANEAFCKLWDIPSPSIGIQDDATLTPREQHKHYRKMYDVELVLRFFAYRQRNTLQKNLSLEVYLDKYLEHGNEINLKTLDEMANLFNQTIEAAYEIFGETAFWMYRTRSNQWGWFSRATTAIYDPLMFNISLFLGHTETLIAKKEQIRSELIDFYKTEYEHFEGRNTTPLTLNKRDELFQSFLSRYI
tara:strand:+ start:1269 stop:2459 length:1191 start_codon:yes stop_codon:yes gene_type:complete